MDPMKSRKKLKWGKLGIIIRNYTVWRGAKFCEFSKLYKFNGNFSNFMDLREFMKNILSTSEE
jgi:hypothetical protein